jgi:hypothetical protein
MDYGWATLQGNSPLPLTFDLFFFLYDFPPVRLRHQKDQLPHRKHFMFPVRIQVACIFCWLIIKRIPIAVHAAIFELAVDKRQRLVRKHSWRRSNDVPGDGRADRRLEQLGSVERNLDLD